MARPRGSTQRGLNQPYPERLAEDLARRYGRMNAEGLRLIRQILVPAILEGNEARVQVALEEIDAALERSFSDERVARMARESAERVDRNHSRLFFTGLAAAVGVRFLGSDRPTGGEAQIPTTPPGSPVLQRGAPRFLIRVNYQPTILSDQFVDNNVRLISTLRKGMMQAVGDQVVREVFRAEGITGDRPVPFTREELTARLVAQWEKQGVPSMIPYRRFKRNGERVFVHAETHAALIARDQISKLNGQLNEARQRAAGIERFVWETQGDSRVRAAHAAIGGRTFTWADGAPVEGTYPGQAIQCRCWARAVVERDQVLTEGAFIPLDPYASQPFTRRNRPGVDPRDPGPGFLLPGSGAFDD